LDGFRSVEPTGSRRLDPRSVAGTLVRRQLRKTELRCILVMTPIMVPDADPPHWFLWNSA